MTWNRHLFLFYFKRVNKIRKCRPSFWGHFLFEFVAAYLARWSISRRPRVNPRLAIMESEQCFWKPIRDWHRARRNLQKLQVVEGQKGCRFWLLWRRLEIFWKRILCLRKEESSEEDRERGGFSGGRGRPCGRYSDESEPERGCLRTSILCSRKKLPGNVPMIFTFFLLSHYSAKSFCTFLGVIHW